jgi:predicted RNA polymerase sigma factor
MAHQAWTEGRPNDPKRWLLTVATRKRIDARRSDVARRRREDAHYSPLKRSWSSRPDG